MISDTNRARGTLCSTERGQKGGKEKKQMDRHTEERERQTDSSHKGLLRRNLVDRCLCV